MAIYDHHGVKLYYEQFGKKHSDKVVVFLNGVMTSVSSWANIIEVFEDAGFRVLLHDFRGQLKSSKPKGPYTFKTHANDTAGLMMHLGIKSAHVIGTSYGGEVGMKLALLYPAMVKSLSLINTVSELDETLIKTIDHWKALAAAYDGALFYKGIVPSIYHPLFIENNQAFIAKGLEGMKKLDPDYFEGQIALYDTFLLDVTMTEDLENIHCPTLVICGADDTLKPPRFSEIISTTINHSEYILIPSCGHVTIFEKPEELKSLLLGFIVKNNHH